MEHETEHHLESDLVALAARIRADDASVSERVGTAVAQLGWHGTGHGAQLRMIDFRTGERKVWIDGGSTQTTRSIADHNQPSPG